MDITYHIVDKEKNALSIDRYFYAGNSKNGAKFIYTFRFGKTIVKYEYVKSSPTTLVYEKLFVNDELCLEYNYFDPSHYINKFKEASTLNIRGQLPPQISAIKFIYNNSVLPDSSPIWLLVSYVSKMLFFRSLTEGNLYIGYSNGSESLSSVIIENKKTADFKKFLDEQGLHYDLVEYNDQNGNPNLGIRFGNNRILPFGSIISSGTKTIWLFYCWMLKFKDLSMLIIDEFDAYYHYSTAQAILKIINGYSNMQAIITTHNMMLMNNDITRPDCCFILDKGEIKSLSQLTNKEIRQKNNLQKMYIDGEFSNLFDEGLKND